MRLIAALTLLLAASACASAPPVPPKPPEPGFDEKMSWILRLEDERVLRDPAPPVPPPPVPVRGQRTPLLIPPPPPPDLVRLLQDGEARIRRRAALAVGRVGLSEAVGPLAGLLKDADPEVQQMAAFALGLIGDARAREPLVAALSDTSLLVRGSAAEALGLIGDAAAAPPVADLAAGIVESGALPETYSEADESVRDSPAGAFRLALFALVRMRAYSELARAVLDAAGRPRVRWWPVAYALQRIEDERARQALTMLLEDAHPYTRAFAAKGLGGIRDRGAVPQLLPLAGRTGDADRMVAVEAIRALGRIADPAGAPVLLKILQSREADPTLRLEAASAIGAIRTDGVYDTLLDLLGDSQPPIRAAAIRALAEFDTEAFVTVLSAMDPDPHWTVRAALATVLGELPADAALPRLRLMLDDADDRVLPSVLAAIAKLRPADAGSILLQHLKRNDPVVRTAAATALGELRVAGGDAALAEAYRFGEKDPAYTARAAALSALSAYGSSAAVPVLSAALADKDWAVRVRAAELLKKLDPASELAEKIRPAPTLPGGVTYTAPQVANPPVSTQVFIDTDRGSIQLELAVLDAPLTVANFVSLVRKGYFNGLTFHRVVPDFVVQAGDPRGDGEGGPGYTIRDELNQRPYLRGTLGMALDWKDTGGSQFFITHSPQPHLDGRYTVFGRVLSGMDVVDRIQQWDVIRLMRVWDGPPSP
jgi:cyclophilin family peptidyl-prolyl cis-trans isomerase/HEAT repeat protein